MATKKPKTAAKKTAATSKTATAKKTVKSVKSPAPVSTQTKKVVSTVETKEEVVEKKGVFKGFFAKKYETDESILTIFKKPELYGAMLGEIIGVMILTLVMLSLSLMGLTNIALYAIALIAIFVAIYAISSAQLNPLVTVGMMATRRMSVIRGVLYIIAQIIGAWFGWLIFNAFHLRGGDTAYAMPIMAEIAEGNFWLVTIIELIGAFIIGFFYARALAYKRSVFTFAAVATGGICAAVLIGFVVSAAFVGLSENFIFNPAIALMYQIFPAAGENFGEVFGGICSALATYALFPMAGGVIGFYLSDFAAKLVGKE